MTETDLMRMLIEVYEQGLADGERKAIFENDRVTGWLRLKDRMRQQFLKLKQAT